VTVCHDGGPRARITTDVTADVTVMAPGAGTPAHHRLTGQLIEIVVATLATDPQSDGQVTLPVTDAAASVGEAYARSGLPLAVALTELDLVVLRTSQRCWATTPVDDVDDLLAAVSAWQPRTAAVRSALRHGYFRAVAEASTSHAVREELALGLVQGRPVASLWSIARVKPAQRYVVLCCRPGRYRGRARLPERLSRELRDAELFGCLDDGRLLVLRALPRKPGGRDEIAEAFDVLAPMVDVAVAGACVSTVDELPAAASQARRALDIATACGSTGPVTARELLVEQAMAQVPSAVAELAGLIDRLVEHPDLLTTLRVLYAHDLARGRAAEALFVVPRTLNKRLERIREITGLSPTSTTGVQTLVSALAAHRMLGHSIRD
jgi:hypothetical protein